MEDRSSWREMSLPYRIEPGEEPEEFSLLSVIWTDKAGGMCPPWVIS